MANKDLKLFDAYPGKSDFFIGVCNYLMTEPSLIATKKFSDQATHVTVDESLSGCNAFIFQSYIPPIGERLYELELAINGVRSRGPDSIAVVLPFHFGSRGERRTRPGEAINLNIVVRKFEDKVNRVITADAHTQSIGTIYDYLGINYIDLLVNPLLADYCMRNFAEDKKFTITALDIGGIEDARRLLKLINEKSKIKCNFTIIDKDRYAPNKSKREYIIGVLQPKVFSKEDMIDTGGTMLDTCTIMKESDVEYISTYATHPIFSGEAVNDFLKALDNKTIDQLILGDTIPIDKRLVEHEKVKVLSLIPLIGEAIKRIHEKHSTSELYNYDPIIKIYANLKGIQQIRTI